MLSIHRRMAVGLLVIATMSCVAAAQPKAPAQASLPILEPQTVMVARFEVQQIDISACVQWISDRTAESDIDAAMKQQALASLQHDFAEHIRIQKELTDLGVKTMYIAVSAADLFDLEPIFYAQMSPTGDFESVRALMMSGQRNGSKGDDVDKAAPNARIAVKLGDGVFRGHASSFKRIQQNLATNAATPNLIATLLADAPAAPIQVVVAPSDDMVRAFEDAMPQLPEPLNNVPTTVLTHGARSIVLTMQPPPKLSMAQVIQSQDAESANALMKLIDDRIKPMLNQPEIKAQVSGIDPGVLFATVSPKVQGDKLVTQLDDAQFRKLAADVLVGVGVEAMQKGQAVAAMNAMRQNLIGIIMYSSDHAGALPDSLDQITKYANGQQINNPRAVAGGKTFAYRKPGELISQVKDPATTIVVYEKLDELPPGTDRIAVGFMDGHVEMLSRELAQQRINAMPGGH